MKPADIGRLRLRNQRLSGDGYESAEQAVGSLLAVQAQEVELAKWSLGMRVRGSSEADIDAPLAARQVLRTHILRPTWHYVLPADIGWLMRLTAPRVVSASRGRLARLGLDARQLTVASDAMARALEDGRQLTRPELGEVIERAGIPVEGQRLAHIVIHAEMNLLVASGAPRGAKQTYALLDLPPTQLDRFDGDAALAELARRYFTSHGPATIADLTWWSTLTTADARRGVDITSHVLERIEVDGTAFWWAGDLGSGSDDPRPTVHLLQAYDEYVVGYRSPRAPLDLAGLGPPGVLSRPPFLHMIVVDTQFAGWWRRVRDGDGYNVETRLERDLSPAEMAELEAAVARYGRFVGRPVRLAA